MKFFKLNVVAFLFAVLSPKNVFTDGPDRRFVESFIKAYDVSGRYNHEYHPLLLEKTRSSFLTLEQQLIENNFSISNRMVILGYQEEAIPAYQTDCSRAYLNDEAVISTARGITTPDRNVFGYLTGFVLKDVQWLQKKLNLEPSLIHIQQEKIDLFSDQSLIFQKHAFQDVQNAVFQTRDCIEHSLVDNTPSKALQHLVTFWEYLYKKSFDNNFLNTVATQDILFSIDYCKALLQAETPIRQVFVGPDITYPIEVSDIQQREVTHNAQKFIKTFMEYVKPVHNKKTAYIFCSFVDGVGKSTLLNNIRNYFVHGDAYERYERCDNSSSQDATLYNIQDDLIIVDLPGQVSHFTSKPQGYVYADINSVKMKRLEQVKVIQHAKKNKDQLVIAFENGCLASDSFEYQFRENCTLLGLRSSQWIPFEFRGKHYLFKKKCPQELRVLVPFEEAHSTGLKTIEPYMMIFSRGLSFPMPIEIFHRDLCKKLKDAAVEEIIFVDFMSMYPRTSRETMRLNFVIQQLRRLFGDRYPLENNLYRPFVHQEQEIYKLLKTAPKDVKEALVLEAVMRWALYELVIQKQTQDLYLLPSKVIDMLLHTKCEELLEQHREYVFALVEKKLKDELVFRHGNYTLDRIYHTIINQSFEDLGRFADSIVQLFTHGIESEYFNVLWSGLSSNLTQKKLQSPLADGSIILDDESLSPATIVNSISGECKNTIILEPLFNMIRAQWYASLENLLYCQRCPDGSYRPKKIGICVPPLVVKKGEDNIWYILQRSLPKMINKNKQCMVPLHYHLIDIHGTRPYGIFAEKPHCFDWSNPGTFFGLFAFGFNPMEKIKSSITLLVEQFAQEFRKKGINNFIIPTSEIARRASQFRLWGLIDKEVVLMHRGPIDHIRPDDPRLPMIRLWARMVATLEMILKDPQSIIVVRKGNRDDFASCLKLLERITLPIYYGMQVDNALFQDYSTVEPIISWDLLTE